MVLFPHGTNNATNQAEDPIEAFDKDLIHDIDKCMALGDQVILGIDANEDVQTSFLAHRLHSECGLQEIMIRNYGENLPNTYARGLTLIDGLFASQPLSQCSSGYTDIVCDHCLLWIDVPVNLALPKRLIL
jgi:hypothetical protein